jgi:hypothetical protein
VLGHDPLWQAKIDGLELAAELVDSGESNATRRNPPASDAKLQIFIAPGMRPSDILEPGGPTLGLLRHLAQQSPSAFRLWLVMAVFHFPNSVMMACHWWHVQAIQPLLNGHMLVPVTYWHIINFYSEHFRSYSRQTISISGATVYWERLGRLSVYTMQ